MMQTLTKKFAEIGIISSLIFLSLLSVVYFEKLSENSEKISSNAISPKLSQQSAKSPQQSPQSGISKPDLYANFAMLLSGNEMIKSLPKNAVVLLRFYNFNTGQRAWEKSYILKTSQVSEGIVDNPDLTIVINSRYLSQITSSNLCSIISSAKTSNDLSVWAEASKASLLWKFKSMLGYRDCLGF